MRAPYDYTDLCPLLVPRQGSHTVAPPWIVFDNVATAMGGDGNGPRGGGRRCTPACDPAPTDAVAWRRRWDGALAAFNRRRGSAGKECAELTAFIPAFHRSVDEFIFNIFFFNFF